jgi:hypothetical protein
VLPSRDNDRSSLAFWTDNFLDVCGDIPDDLWTVGVTELLRTKVFRPQPSELISEISLRHRERERMLARAQKLLAAVQTGRRPTPDDPVIAPQPKTRADQLRETIERGKANAETFIGPILMKRARDAEKELAQLENRSPADWTFEPEVILKMEPKAESTLTVHEPAWMRASLNRSIARSLHAQGFHERARKLENEAQKLQPLDDLGRPMLTVDDLDVPEASPIDDVEFT